MQWDVNNEMLHGSFFADRQGAAIRDWMYTAAVEADPDVDLFVNDFDVVENGQLTQVNLMQKNFEMILIYFTPHLTLQSMKAKQKIKTTTIPTINLRFCCVFV